MYDFSSFAPWIFGSLEKFIQSIWKEASGEVKNVAFFEALRRNIINPDHAMRMIEVQIACGGIIDPVLNHRLPTELAIEQKKLSDEIIKRIDAEDTKGYYDINTGENLTYVLVDDRNIVQICIFYLFSQLLKRCIIDEVTKLPMIVDHRDLAMDTAPIRTTLTTNEIESLIRTRFNKEITIDVCNL